MEPQDLHADIILSRLDRVQFECPAEFPMTNTNCVLFLWTDSQYLRKAIQMMEDKGFEYVCTVFVQVNRFKIPGPFTNPSCEFVLLGKRGHSSKVLRLWDSQISVDQICMDSDPRNPLDPCKSVLVRAKIDMLIKPGLRKLEVGDFGQAPYKDWIRWEKWPPF